MPERWVPVRELRVSRRFEKSFDSLPTRIQQLVRKQEARFQADPTHPSLRTHHLKGKLKAYHSFSAGTHYRVVFKRDTINRVTLIDIGTHEVYRLTTPLQNQRCIPCEAGTPPLSKEEAVKLHSELPAGWTLTETAIQKRFKFRTFPEAIAFVDRVAELAETEGHHPDLDIRYRRVTVTLTTHAIHGLSSNDFILAAKIEPLAGGQYA